MPRSMSSHRRHGRTKERVTRLDPKVYEALVRWSEDELRSTTARIELLLRNALRDAGRLPSNTADMPRRGRPPRPERNSA
jgi:hypothetical protein